MTFDVVRLREFLPLGQRVNFFALDAMQDGTWHEFYKGAGIGSQRLIRARQITTSKVRLRFMKAFVCPAISEFGLFCEPKR